MWDAFFPGGWGSRPPGTPRGTGIHSFSHSLAHLPCRVAFAELNVQLQHHAQLLRDVLLRGYHSFTRGPKATVFQRAVDADRQFPADRGAPPVKEPPGGAPPFAGKLQTSPAEPGSGSIGGRAGWQGPECWRPVWRPQELPVYLQMASTVLQTAYGRYADASICIYSFAPPPCLAQVRLG